MQSNTEKIVYSKNVIEFVTVAVQFCNNVENITNTNQTQLSDWAAKILPLLYLKAVLLPQIEIPESDIQTNITEEQYETIRTALEAVFAADDIYLEVFIDDMKYSDTPVRASISENLADIYQDIKNFVSIYEVGNTDLMYEALAFCISNFADDWGQKLVNVLRAIHCLKYATPDRQFPPNNHNNRAGSY
jgi:hypothetical protein